MKEIHLIQQLFLQDGILKSKVGRSTKKVHYRQGELDGVSFLMLTSISFI